MIKKEILIALSAATLLLGCVDSSTGAAARADMEGTSEKVEAPAHEAKHEAKKAEAPVAQKAEAPAAEEKKAEEAPAAEEKKAEAPAETAAAEAPKEAAPAAAAEVNTAACTGCHGASFEKKAMGVSKVVKDMSKADIVTALKGYKDGSYGANMKALMKGQVASLDDAAIEAIANKIGK